MAEQLLIEGGVRLRGEIDVHGAKNSSLPILAASLLSGGETILHNCPKLSDVAAAVEILQHLGCIVTVADDAVIINSDNVNTSEIPQKLMHEMRSSIVFLGPIISRMKEATLYFPGGCELGARPIDLHISALRQLGVRISEEGELLRCSVGRELCGKKIALSFPSVGATENIMLASVLAKGETIIVNAAQEPEIVDLANYLISRGAKIKDAGKSTVIIKGVKKLNSTEYTVMPDRIVAATFITAAAITGGEVLINKLKPNDLESVIPIIEQAGASIKRYGNSVYVDGPAMIKPVKSVRTMPYPGFPTDAQAPVMALLSLANGTSVFVENIFENRYKHVSELVRMGADIKIEGRVAVVEGVKKLYGASVEATDLRGGAALVAAALAADGNTSIKNIFHIDRGYEHIEQALRKIEAKIIRDF